MEEVFVIAGLGNPGSRYENTRHNVGFEALDRISQSLGIPVHKIKFKGLMGEGKIDEKKVILIKPQTYMNLSGECIVEVMQFYKVPTQQLIVLYDDIDFEAGSFRIKPKGSAGSHNGMKSILYHLQTDSFPRVRIGIGKPLPYFDLADYVLSKFDIESRKRIDASLKLAADAVLAIIKNGMDQAMNQYNKTAKTFEDK